MPKKILVALSGGPDSVSLLYFLKKQDFDVYAAHLNHKIRGPKSREDEFFVKKLCKELNIPLIVKSIDVPRFAKKNKLSLEDAGRRCRYKFLEKAAVKFGAPLIALGHNADDNVETFLMNLIRGAGLKGLSGIPPLREIPNKSQISIIRPLLNIWRKDIFKYLKKYKLKYMIDKSNYDTKFFRNLVRQKIMPKIDKNKIASLIKNISEQYGLIEKMAALELESNGLHSGLLTLPDQLKSEVVRAAIKGVKGNLADIESVHIRNILGCLGKTETWQVNLPGGMRAVGDRDAVKITKTPPRKPVDFKYKLRIPGITDIPNIEDKINAVLDFNKTGKALYIRNWRPGDKFQPLGMKGTKKISDYFIDQKIPMEEKSRIPIIVNGKDQVVCVGNRIDERFKVENTTKKILNLL